MAVDHREAAEKLLDQMCFTGALAHAVLALVDRLDGITFQEEDEE